MKKSYLIFVLLFVILYINIDAQLQTINNGLHIPGVYNFEQVNLQQLGNGACGLELVNHSGWTSSYGIRLKANVDEVYGLQFQIANSANDYNSLNYSTKMFLGINGNVGIGTIIPKVKLEVAGNTYISNASIGRSGGHYDEIGYNIGFTDQNNMYTYRVSDYAASIRMGYNGSIEFRTAISGIQNTNLSLIERMKITHDGNVGIGSLNPIFKLDIEGTGNTTSIHLKRTDAFASWYMHSGRLGTGEFSIGDENQYRFVISSIGNVLIGKTIQEGTGTRHKLDVAGSIRANEVVVNTTGADFVFAPDYKLRKLSEVEQHIKDNGHLPDIAPAADMQQNGVSVSEMQTKLLQKVEELTLYSIEQNKTIEKQQKHIDALFQIIQNLRNK